MTPTSQVYCEDYEIISAVLGVFPSSFCKLKALQLAKMLVLALKFQTPFLLKKLLPIS